MLLDIDFDYFVKETTYHDFGYYESNFFMNSLWDTRFITYFARNIDLTKEFTLDEVALNEVFESIKKCNIETWAISDSHLFAYNFIGDEAFPISILHIDRHDDYGIIKDEIHCGNWLRYIHESLFRKNIKKIPTYWIPQSKDDWYVDEKAVKGKIKIKTRKFLKSQSSEIRCIFLTRSSAWTPPWLDDAYFNFQAELEELFGEPLKYEPIPEKRPWDYDKLVEQGLKKRNKPIKNNIQ